MAKVRVDVTVDADVAKQVDELIQTGKYASRSHAVNYALKELLKKETVRF